jgi:hypothetical protein
MALSIVAKGPSVFSLFGSGSLPDQELFPLVATKNVASGVLFKSAFMGAIIINSKIIAIRKILRNISLLSNQKKKIP